MGSLRDRALRTYEAKEINRQFLRERQHELERQQFRRDIHRRFEQDAVPFIQSVLGVSAEDLVLINRDNYQAVFIAVLGEPDFVLCWTGWASGSGSRGYLTLAKPTDESALNVSNNDLIPDTNIGPIRSVEDLGRALKRREG